MNLQKVKIIYIVFATLLALLFVGYWIIPAPEESLARSKALLPLVGTYVSMILGVMMIGLATYIYYKKPETGKDGWGVIAVGCVLVVMSFVKSAKISPDGLEIVKEDLPLFTKELTRQATEQQVVIDHLKEQIAFVQSDLEDLKKNSSSISSKNLINSIMLDKPKAEASIDQLVERADAAPIILLTAIEEALSSKNALTVESWRKLLDNTSKHDEVRPGYMALMARIISKLKEIEGTSEYVSTLEAKFRAYLETDVPFRSENMLHITGLFSSAVEIIGDSFPGTEGQNRLYFNYVRSYGVKEPSFTNVKPGDLLKVSAANWMAPLRAGMPGFFGTMADEIRWDSRKVLLKVVSKELTPVLNAQWLQVEIVYIEDKSDGPKKGTKGYIAWFNYRFINAGL